MSHPLRQLVAKFGWRMPLQRVLSPHRTVVLTYHGIPRHSDSGIDGEVFEQQISFLKANFQLVSISELEGGRRLTDPVKVLLTLDDGFLNNAEVAAVILRKLGVPAVFFVCSRHATPGRYLWFAYLRALERWWPHKDLFFAGERLDMSAENRVESVSRLRETLLRLRPHPSAMYRMIDREGPRLEEFVPTEDLRDSYMGMTAENVAALGRDDLFTIGIHTVDHPRLPLCEASELHGQILQNKMWIEELTGRPCDLMAYPEAEYDSYVLHEVQALGIKNGFAVEQRAAASPRLQFPRVGIYGASTDELGFKVRWGQLLNRIPLRARMYMN